jgi:hypothetical protein
MARRLDLHPNTISAAYQDLGKRGWVSRRRGSGVFVQDLRMPEDERNLEVFVHGCVEDGLARGFPLEALHAAFGRLVHDSRLQRFLVVDPDPHMARILAAEIGEATARILPFSSCDEAGQMLTADTCILASSAQASKVGELLGGVSLRTIQLKSMQDVLAGHQRPASAVLIAVVSRSESILRWASTLLAALGFPADSVLERNPDRAHWQDGLAACDIVATDVVTAIELPKGARPTVFRVVSDEFLAEFRKLVTA